MRVLHVWEVSSTTISTFMDRIYGTRSAVLCREKYDPYGHNTTTPNLQGSVFEFYGDAVLWASRADIVHIHSRDRLAPMVKRLKKPVVMHYHGSDIRGKWQERRKRWEKADALMVSTPDLLEGAPENAVYLPNPVNTDLFHPDAVEHARDSAVHFSKGADDLATEIARENELPLIIVKQRIMRRDMPPLLRNYTHLVDVKRSSDGEVLRARSLLALEALACGLQVLSPDGVVKGLPEEHRPENVVKTLYELYTGLMG